VTSEHCRLYTGWHRTYNHTIFSAKPVRQQTHVITFCNHDNCTVILSTTHKKLCDQTTNSSFTAHPQFWQLHTADGRQTFSIFVTLFEPEINTGQTKLPAIHNVWMTSTVHLFSIWWHIQQFSGLLALLCFFYDFPEHCRCCSIAKQTQPFYAIQISCHNEKWRSTYSKHNVCPPSKHRKIQTKFFHWPYWVCTYHHTNALHIMGNHCSDQSQHKPHPHFYSNAFPLLTLILSLSFHTTAWDTNNLNARNICH